MNQRIQVPARGSGIEGRQSFADFMMRRYEPAMRTVKSTESTPCRCCRTGRSGQGELLRTQGRCGTRAAQNQALLESMDRRADLALRLQHTVEGLSVVAISYYAVSLAAYLALSADEPRWA